PLFTPDSRRTGSPRALELAAWERVGVAPADVVADGLEKAVALGEEGHADDPDVAVVAHRGGVRIVGGAEAERCHLALALAEALDAGPLPQLQHVAALVPGPGAAVHHVEPVDGGDRLDSARAAIPELDRVAFAVMPHRVGSPVASERRQRRA